MTVDGLNVGNPPGGGQPPTYVADIGNAQEIAFTTSGGLGESETAGLVMNVVPKTGGNAVHGAAYLQRLRREAPGRQRLWRAADQRRIRLQWLCRRTDHEGSRLVLRQRAHAGKHAKHPRHLLQPERRRRGRVALRPDPTRPQYTDRTWENLSGRVTWQATPRNKIGGSGMSRSCAGRARERRSASPIRAYGSRGGRLSPVQAASRHAGDLVVARDHRLLFDAGFGTTYYGWGNFERDPNPTRNLIRVTESCASGCADNGGVAGHHLPIAGLRQQLHRRVHVACVGCRTSPGAHSMKVGYLGTYFKDDRTWFTNDQNLAYQFNNGVPNRLTPVDLAMGQQRAGGVGCRVRAGAVDDGPSHAAGGVALRHARSWYPEQQIGPSRFLPTPIIFPETKGVDSYKDISPRVGVAYDVFGNGRTALKANVGKYLEGVGTSGNYANANPTLRMPSHARSRSTRKASLAAWTDSNNNFVPDCDLTNSAAQNLTASGGDVCGVMSNVRFGQNVLTNNFDPDLLNGWGVRPSDWNVGVTLQQQLFAARLGRGRL